MGHRAGVRVCFWIAAPDAENIALLLFQRKVACCVDRYAAVASCLLLQIALRLVCVR